MSVPHSDTKSFKNGVLMTDSGVATIPEGTGYHAFRGPRPVAWDQRSNSDADRECTRA